MSQEQREERASGRNVRGGWAADRERQKRRARTQAKPKQKKKRFPGQARGGTATISTRFGLKFSALVRRSWQFIAVAVTGLMPLDGHLWYCIVYEYVNKEAAKIQGAVSLASGRRESTQGI